ncbi:MAG: YicC/YloC family endoribonuclease [Chitinophagales bacterium]
MLYSMTGYGKASTTLDNKIIEVQVKSLNSKFLDLNVRMPQIYRSKEISIRQKFSKQLRRGKVDLNISVEDLSGTQGYKINKEAFAGYYKDLKQLQETLQLPESDVMTAIMRIPDVTIPSKGEVTSEEFQCLTTTIQAAIEHFKQFRSHEGQALEVDLRQNIQTIEENLAVVEEYAPLRINKIKERLQTALHETIGAEKVDNNRFEQELIYYIDKMDINEETVRLSAHCQHFKKEMGNKTPLKGKKLSFVAQEIGREINTIGAKANNATIQTHVIKMKNALDKIKEQLMNVL